MKLDFEMLSKLNGDELLCAMGFPFDEVDNKKLITEWIYNSGFALYLFDMKYRMVTLDAEHFDVYEKVFLAVRNKLDYFRSVCPKNGEFIGYKAVLLDKDYDEKNAFDIGIVELVVPKDAKRINPYFVKKCRCDKAFIKSIRKMQADRTRGELKYYRTDNNEHESVNDGWSYFDLKFKYEVGKIIKARYFNEDPWAECGSGIHFFMTEDLAINFAKNLFFNVERV